MVMVKLGYDPNLQNKWRELPREYSEKEYNDKLVVVINEWLWKKIQNIIYIRKKGYDALVLLDGKRRTGKSTLGMTIAYLLNPDITIDNYVSGLEEAPDKIDKAKDEGVLIFDEGSLVANTKDVMKRKNVQLEKIIDVVGQKKLTLIFCMPSFFSISRPIAITHSLFLIHVYTDDKLTRGRFAFFGEKKKKRLYEIGKKNFGSYSKPKSDFTGLFYDFHLPFEKEYLQLKRDSLREALDPNFKNKDKKVEISPIVQDKIIDQFLCHFRLKAPEITIKLLAKAFCRTERSVYQRLSKYHPLSPEKVKHIQYITLE